MRRAWVGLREGGGISRLLSPCGQWRAEPLRKRLSKGFSEAPGEFFGRWKRSGPRAFAAPGPEGFEALRARYLSLLREHCGPDAAAGIVADAERIIAGEYPFFSCRRVALGWPPDWHPGPWAAFARAHWSRVPSFSGEDDIKDCWEPGRFAAAYAFVRAYFASGDERFAEAFWTMLESWRAANPPNTGPHWRCGQEISLRVMAWVFALNAFRDSPSTTPARLAMMVGMLDEQARRIAATTDYARLQDNNHSISEGMGLWCAGLAFPELKKAAVYREKGRLLLEGEAARLIADDGSFSQMSSNYHRLMLHDYIFAIRMGASCGEELSKETLARVEKAAAFLCGTMDGRSGFAPNSGGNDGALVLPLDLCDYSDMRPVCAAAHALFRRERLFGDGPWTEDLFFLFGPESVDWPAVGAARSDLSAGRGGYYTLRGRETWAMLRCGAYRTRPRHADCLHLDIWWRGLNIAADPGSFRYFAPAPWNDGLKHTCVHNTVTVDGLDQLVQGPRFMWLEWHDARVLKEESGPGWRRIEAEHDGYLRLADPVRHRRSVTLEGEDCWIVVDELLGEGEHDLLLHWLLPDFPYRLKPDGRLLLQCEEGDVSLGIDVCGPDVRQPQISVLRADEKSCQGWISRRYGEKTPALSLSANCRCRLPATFTSTFSFAVREGVR
jgi:asparagine synthase (glutamine-hydrolysing)